MSKTLIVTVITNYELRVAVLADALTPDEQLHLISHLTQRRQDCEIKRKPRRNIMEFIGIAPNLLGGIDAQEYVTRMRRGEFPDLEYRTNAIKERGVNITESLQLSMQLSETTVYLCRTRGVLQVPKIPTPQP